MSRADTEADIHETLGLVPSFMDAVPDFLIESEWASFKAIEVAETAIPNKYKELIGLAVSGATRDAMASYMGSDLLKGVLSSPHIVDVTSKDFAVYEDLTRVTQPSIEILAGAPA